MNQSFLIDAAFLQASVWNKAAQWVHQKLDVLQCVMCIQHGATGGGLSASPVFSASCCCFLSPRTVSVLSRVSLFLLPHTSDQTDPTPRAVWSRLRVSGEFNEVKLGRELHKVRQHVTYNHQRSEHTHECDQGVRPLCSLCSSGTFSLTFYTADKSLNVPSEKSERWTERERERESWLDCTDQLHAYFVKSVSVTAAASPDGPSSSAEPRTRPTGLETRTSTGSEAVKRRHSELQLQSSQTCLLPNGCVSTRT